LETVLEINNLTKRYGSIKAIDNLSLSVEKGSVHGLLGPNGSGKTTTLGILLGVLNATSGTFNWFNAPNHHEQRKKIGAILEHPIFYPYLTAFQNLQIVANIKGVPESRIDEVLEYVNLFERRHYPFRTFSLGMKQRLAIGSALLANPEVMVLDEPTNGLDPQGIAEVRNLIKDIAAKGTTIILASHLLDEVQKVCTHVALLKKGNRIFNGRVEEMLGSKNFIRLRAQNSDADLKTALQSHEAVIGANPDAENPTDLLVEVTQANVAAALNEYLFKQGIVLSHLSVEKQSLEKQVLQLLQETENANPPAK